MNNVTPQRTYTPNWFGDAITAGLQRLVALRLPGTPSAEMIGATAKVWIAALVSRPIAWEEQRDLPRIQQAFLTLTATMDRWPSPSDFMAAFPRSEPLTVNRLPKPQSRSYPPGVREFLDKFLSKGRA